NLETRRFGADAGDDFAQEPRPVLERAAIGAGPRTGAQQLVSQVAVTVLDVDEREAGARGEHRGADEVVDERTESRVRDDRRVAGHADARVELRMTVGDDRLGPAGTGSREAAGVGELQADQEVV